MSRPQSIDSTRTHPRDALITTSAVGQLELRQNNPQDCSNLIRASVDRATVEISRTIIALNATFSQQLDQARISASNGIRSAQDSATSTINIVVQSASVATSSAFSSVRIANLAVTSANVALTSATDALNTANLALTSALAASTSVNDALATANFALTSALSASTSLNAAFFNANFALTSALSASSSDVLRLSSSSSSDVARLSASLRSAQASLAAAQGGLGTITDGQGQQSYVLNLNAAQIAGIVVGSVVFSILLGIAAGCLVIRMKRSRRGNQVDEKDEPKISAASLGKDDEKKPRKPPPPIMIENPFLSPEELALPSAGALSKNDSLAVASQEPHKSEVVSTETRLQRNFSLPRNKEDRKRRSPETPKPELEPRAGEEDWTNIAEARKQAIEGVSQGSSAPIVKESTNVVEPTRNLPPGHIKPAKSSSALDLDEEIMEIVTGFSEEAGAARQKERTAGVADPSEGAETGLENPFDDVNAIISEVLGDRSRDRSRKEGRRHVSPLRRNPVSRVFEKDEPVPPLPSLSSEQRAVSPLRRNPVFRRPVGEEPVPPLPSLSDKQRALSPLRRNPVVQRLSEQEPVPPLPPIQRLPDKQRALSPLRRNPVAQRLSEQEPVPPLPPIQRLPDKQRALSPLRSPVVQRLSEQEPVPSLPLALKLDEERPSPVQRDASEMSPVMREPSAPMQSPPIPSPPMPSPPMPSPPMPPSPMSSSSMSAPPIPSPPMPPSPMSSSSMSPSPMPSPQLTAQTSFPLDLDLSTESHDVGIDVGIDELEETELPEKDNEPSESGVREDTSEEDTQEQLDEDWEDYLDEHSDEESEETEDASEVDERVTRGRSMLRTSDIIEARLSAIAQARAKTNVPDTVTEESEVSSMRSSMATSPESSPEPAQVGRTEPPLRSSPRTIEPPKESTQGISVLPLRLTPPAREKSPVRRSPPLVLKSSPLVLEANKPEPKPTALLRAAPAQPKAGKNAQFSQAFLMFKSLDSKNPQNAAAATSEVNHRALAGIHVPASLREVAVRNLSKSRERGKSRMRDVGQGA